MMIMMKKMLIVVMMVNMPMIDDAGAANYGNDVHEDAVG